jgi:hypothetical protein
MHNLSRSQQEETFSQGDPWWTCAGPRLRCNCLLNRLLNRLLNCLLNCLLNRLLNRLLDDDVLPARVSLEDSQRRAAFTPPPDVIDNAILQAVNQIPLASVRELAKFMCISCAIVWGRRTGFFGFVVNHLHWVPHHLTDAQGQIRIDRSNELLRFLESAQANDWQIFATLDESWFYLWTSYEKV